MYKGRQNTKGVFNVNVSSEMFTHNKTEFNKKKRPKK